jgi:hypothetical protein
MMIIWWSKHVGVILNVLVCDIWINVLLQTSALVGPLYIVNWNARWNCEKDLLNRFYNKHFDDDTDVKKKKKKKKMELPRAFMKSYVEGGRERAPPIPLVGDWSVWSTNFAASISPEKRPP